MSEKTTNFAGGAIRSSDANHLDFTSIPLLGLLGVARTSGEGGAKYGRYNYMMGMPAHDLLNHALRHQLLFILGDRSEPHLEHAAWGLLAAIQSLALDPEISDPHLLGPGATLTPAVREHLAAIAPELKRRREEGEFDGFGNWDIRDIPEVQRLLLQRVTADLDEEIPAEEPTAMVPLTKEQLVMLRTDDGLNRVVFEAQTAYDPLGQTAGGIPKSWIAAGGDEKSQL